MQDIEKFKQLLEKSQRILITSHISPDPDAIASVLLLGTTLKQNFPQKDVLMVLEEEPEGLDFLAGYQDIKFGSLLDNLRSFKPDLFVLLDAPNYDRCSRKDPQLVQQYITDNKVKTAFIDHHEPTGKDNSDVYIHQGSVATAQDVYEICFDQLTLQKPPGYAETTMLGIYSDSGGFTYKNQRHKETFKIVNDLLASGVNLEQLKHKLNSYSPEHLKVLAEFIKNTSSANDYTYTYLSDEFTTAWLADKKKAQILSTAKGMYSDRYLRNIGDRKWGFIVSPDFMQGEDFYAVSFRSADESIDVAKIANKLGGGGHKPAAGARIQAKNVKEAIQKVQQAISST